MLWKAPVGRWKGFTDWLRSDSRTALLAECVVLVLATTAVLWLAAALLWGQVDVRVPLLSDSFAGDSGQ